MINVEPIKVKTPENKKKCWNCDFKKWKPRKDGKYGYCTKHDKYFGDDKDLGKITCEFWE